MDPLHFCIAVAPLAVYCTMIGMIHLMRRPFLTTGSRDMAALAIGLCGLVIAGPMELFFPANAAMWAGVLVWPLLLAFYGLNVTLIVLMMRPRLVIYNISPEQLRPLLGDLANQIDGKSRWSGENLLIPSIHVQLQMESLPILMNVQLVATGNHQSMEGWQRLEQRLRVALREVNSRPGPLGVGLLIVSALTAIGTGVWIYTQRQEVAQSLQEMLRL